MSDFHAGSRRLSSALLRAIQLLMLIGLLAVPISPAAAAAPATAVNSCQLDPGKKTIQHVIQIQFDNTHFTRDNPNVPSDLEQMPHLLNFIENNEQARQSLKATSSDTVLVAPFPGSAAASR